MTERDGPWMPYISDQTLIAWQAGRLPAEQTAAIAARLLVDPDLADRSTRLDPLGEALRDGLAPLLDMAPAHQMTEALQAAETAAARPAVWRRNLVGAGMLAAGFAAGVVIGPSLPHYPARAPGWVMAASNMVRLVSPQVGLVQDSDPQDLAASIDRVTRATGVDLADYSAGFDGFRPLRVDLLAFEGKPLIQLSYATAADDIVVLCLLVRPTSVPQDSPRIAEAFDGLASLRWDQANLGILVVGTKAEAVTAMARQL